MILQVENNPEEIDDGEVVIFLTGKYRVGTIPKYLRIGEVIDSKNWKIKEVSTGKIWQVYTGDVIKVGEGTPVQGVKATLILTNHP